MLTRRRDEVILIDGPARISVIEVRGSYVRIGIEADQGVKIMREEVVRRERESRRRKPA